MSPQEKRKTIRSLDDMRLDARLLKAKRPIGSVLLVHGFGVDLHEEGTFDEVTRHLAERDLSVARFSFRGHGQSGGTQEGMTIAGERMDLSAAYAWLTANLAPPYAILAASFGAVATALQLGALRPAPEALLLWNPVLNLQHVFVEPTTSWGKQNFGRKALSVAREKGYALVDGSFRAGFVLMEEFQLYQGNLGSQRLRTQHTLIYHGTSDTYVPIGDSRHLIAYHNIELKEVEGAGHGFPEPDSEEAVIKGSVTWLAKQLLRI